MTECPGRFYAPGRPAIIECFRAMRTAFEKIVEAPL